MQTRQNQHTTTATAADDETETASEFLLECALNEELGEVRVADVRLTDTQVVFEFEPVYGDGTITREFDRPDDYALTANPDLVDFLDRIDANPKNIDALVGSRVPAVYDTTAGEWRLAPAEPTWGDHLALACRHHLQGLSRLQLDDLRGPHHGDIFYGLAAIALPTLGFFVGGVIGAFFGLMCLIPLAPLADYLNTAC